MPDAATAITLESRPSHKIRARVFGACCGAHALHDGYSDLLYVLLPVWQAEFGLSLAQVGLLKSIYSAAMAALQVPAGIAAERLGERRLLVLGTALAAAGFLLVGFAGSIAGLMVCLALAGFGASVQHPLSSALMSRAFEGPRLRPALGTYNFSGDVGKVLLPAATAWLVVLVAWRGTTSVLGVIGIVAAGVIYAVLPAVYSGPAALMQGKSNGESSEGETWSTAARRGFAALSGIGMIDSATRTGFLTFLPFLLTQKGASLPTVGIALGLTFAGGAAGKFACGIIASRLGILRTVVITECATAAGILALIPLPLEWAVILLPVVGLALNGTSSVLYGTVAELAPAKRRARAFGLFYTFGIGAGAIAPTVYGIFSDTIGVSVTLAVVAAVVLLVLPLVSLLRPALQHRSAASDGLAHS